MKNIERIVRQSGYRVLALRGGWTPEMDAEIDAGGFDELAIHMGEWPNFEFLVRHKSKIDRLSITSPVKSFRGVETLTQLRELCLHDAPNPPISLTAFKSLETCEIKWHKGYSSAFFEIPSLREVTLMRYTSKNCREIAAARHLRKLDLRQGQVESLTGMEVLVELKSISLAYMRNLHDVSAISDLAHLESLHIERCPKVEDVQFVERLSNLRNLFLDCGGNGFRDLRWMGKMQNLTEVLIAVPVQEVSWETVFSLPNLQRVVINTHPGYALGDEALHLLAVKHGRQITNFVRAGTRKHPGFKFWMAPLAVH